MNNSYKLSWMYGLTNGTRMLIGAINTIFLLETGVKLGQIAMLQLVFSITVLVLEFPSGVLADAISRKKSVLLSTFSFIFYYFLCTKSPNIGYLIISQIVYGAGMCFMSGAIEAWITSEVYLEYPNDKNKLNYFGYFRDELSAGVTMFSGSLGAIIAYKFNNYIPLYIFCSLLMVIYFLIFMYIPDHSKISEVTHSNLKFEITKIINDISNTFKTKAGILYLLIESSLVCTYQIIFFYWQSYFVLRLHQSNNINTFLSNKEFLLAFVFFSYSLAKYLINRHVRKYLLKKIPAFTILFISSLICALLIILFSFKYENLIIYIIIYSLFQASLAMVTVTSQAQFLKKIPELSIASILSAVNALTRILGIGLLAIISIYITNDNLHYFIRVTSIFYLLVLVISIIWNIEYNSNTKINNINQKFEMEEI